MDMTIKTADPQMAMAIAEGAAAVQLQEARREITRLQAIEGVRREADEKRWKRTRKKLARKYSIRPVGRVRGAILGVWGLLWLCIDEAYQYFSAWNREG